MVVIVQKNVEDKITKNVEFTSKKALFTKRKLVLFLNSKDLNKKQQIKRKLGPKIFIKIDKMIV